MSEIDEPIKTTTRVQDTDQEDDAENEIGTQTRVE